MASIGERLQKARKSKGFSIEDVHKNTKIAPSILRALEENSADKFLNPVYIKGFLKKYAAFLGLDNKKLIEEYGKNPEAPKEIPSVQNAEIVEKSLDVHEPVQKMKTNPDKFPETLYKSLSLKAPAVFKILLSILLVVLVIFMSFKIIVFTKSKIVNISKTIKASAAMKSEKKAKQKIQKQIQETQEQAKPLISAFNIPEKDPLILTVRTSKDVWIDIKVDGVRVFRNVLSSGSVESWQANQKFELWVGKAEAVDLIVNNYQIGNPGRGVQKGIIIDRKGIKLP